MLVETQTASSPAGSQWNKWDLHVHAPGTMKNDAYRAEGVTLDDFVQKISSSEYSAIGITDYYSISTAFEVKEKLKNIGSSVQVFPNVEFRDPRTPAKSRTNFHVIFSNKLTEKEISDVLNRIRVQAGTESPTIMSLDKESIQSAVVLIEDVCEQLKLEWPDGQEYIVVAASGDDGVRPKGERKDWGGMNYSDANSIIRTVMLYLAIIKTVVIGSPLRILIKNRDLFLRDQMPIGWKNSLIFMSQIR